MVRTRSEKKTAQVPLVSGEKTANGRVQKDKKTDYRRWRLLDERGRQTWHYLRTDEETEKWPQSVADKYYLGLPTVGFWLDSDDSSTQRFRTNQSCHKQKLLFKPYSMDSNSSPNFNCPLETGDVNMVARSFLSQGLL
jgi:hypothetical protein